MQNPVNAGGKFYRGGIFRFTSLVLAGGVLMASMIGCYGRFPLTNAVYKWNGEVTDNGFINSIVMLVLGLFLPVYGISILVDAIILNSIEYWKGEKVEVGKTYVQPDGTEVAFEAGSHENEILLSVYRDGQLIEQRTFVRQDDGSTRILTSDRKVVSVVTPDNNGGFTFTNASGVEIGALSSSQIAEFSSRVN